MPSEVLRVDQPCLFAKIFDRERDRGRLVNAKKKKRQNSRGGLAKEYALYIFIYIFVFERGGR